MMRAQHTLVLVFILLVAARLCAAQQAPTCPASFFGPASAYNVFLLGGGANTNTFDLINGDVEGRVACNGNFRAINFGIGSRRGSCNASTPTVVIGGTNSTISFSGGVQCGSLVAETSANITSLPGFANGQLQQGAVSTIAGIDFAAAKIALQNQTTSLCEASGIAATISANAITLTGSATSSLIFNINGTDLTRASSLNLRVPNATAVQQVVIKITGSSAINLSGFQTFLNGVSSGLVTFVVCSASSIRIENLGLEGNLFAPFSTVTIQNAQLLGNVVALSLNGSGSGEVHIPACPITPGTSPLPSGSASPAISASPEISTSASPASSPLPSSSALASPLPSPTVPLPSSSVSLPSPSAATSPSASPSASSSPLPSASVSASPPAPSSPSPSAALSPSPSVIVSTPQPSASTPASPSPAASASPSATPLCPAPLFGANVSAYNVFLLGSQGAGLTMNLTNGDIEGRLAVDGSIRTISFNVGSRLSPCNSSLPSVIVGGANATVQFQGNVQCGSLVAESGTNITQLPSFTNGSSLLGSVQNVTGLNFTAEALQLSATANALCAANATAATVSAFREITFQGSASAAIQAFTVNASDINRAASIAFSFPNASAITSVVVAIKGNDSLTFTNFAINTGGAPSAYFTYVVCGSAQVTLRGFGLSGNLLAYNSSITLENGQIVGTVVALTLNGSSGGEIHVPVCPTPTPSPALSPSPAASASGLPSASPSVLASTLPSLSASPSAAASPSSATSPSSAPSRAASPSLAVSPSATASPSPLPSVIVSTPQPSLSPSAVPSPSIVASPSTAASPSAVASPSTAASPSAAASPSTLPSPSCPPSFFGAAAGFNVFLSGNANQRFTFNLTNGDVWGKIAVNGSLFARSFGIGTRLNCTADAAKGATAIVAGPAVDFTGEVQCGNLVTTASTSVSGVSFRNGQTITGDILTITGVDFTAIAASLASASASLCSANGTTSAVVGAGNGITFVGSSTASQIFTITTAQLRQATSIRFAFADVAVVRQVVINVVGPDAADVSFSGFDVNLGGAANGLFTWNVCSATSVAISNFGFQGNLLAPGAGVVLTNAQINGNVAASTLNGSGSGEVHLPQCP